jgi:hypothetical protein
METLLGTRGKHKISFSWESMGCFFQKYIVSTRSYNTGMSGEGDAEFGDE